MDANDYFLRQHEEHIMRDDLYERRRVTRKRIIEEACLTEEADMEAMIKEECDELFCKAVIGMLQGFHDMNSVKVLEYASAIALTINDMAERYAAGIVERTKEDEL